MAETSSIGLLAPVLPPDTMAAMAQPSGTSKKRRKIRRDAAETAKLTAQILTEQMAFNAEKVTPPDADPTIAERIFSFLEHPLFSLPVSVILGLVGVFVYGPWLAGGSIFILGALLRSAALRGLSTRAKAITAGGLWLVSAGFFVWIGFYIDDNHQKTWTLDQVAGLWKNVNPGPTFTSIFNYPRVPASIATVDFGLDSTTSLDHEVTVKPANLLLGGVWLLSQRIDLPMLKAKAVPVTAKNVHLWIRACDQCAWMDNGNGFNASQASPNPQLRDKQLGNIGAGAPTSIAPMSIMIPLGANSFGVALSYICDNCRQSLEANAVELKVNVQRN
ncbi:MAG TPA: hypothetical protein VK638_59280 [Edaphobacter sp.]|nr:hypothetical protein [Edaphobacter sp.]